MTLAMSLVTKSTISLQVLCGIGLQGAPIKNNPLGKIQYLSYYNRFFQQIYSFHRGGFRPHAQQILLQYLLWFKIYNHLNLKIQFSE